MATNTTNLNLVKPDLTDPVDIDVLNGNADILDGLGVGYRYVQTIYYTSNGTFTKASYPWLRAIRVKCQAGGGGGAGANTTGSNRVAMGRAGTGGSYAESFITDIAGLDASVTVTRGAGGAGGIGATAGGAGGDSSFGGLVVGIGGGGGGSIINDPPPFNNIGNVGTTTGTGDLVIAGGSSQTGIVSNLDFLAGGMGGDSHLGAGGRGAVANANGVNGAGFGSGGGAGANSQNQSVNRTGGAGGNGIVIVELFA